MKFLIQSISENPVWGSSCSHRFLVSTDVAGKGKRKTDARPPYTKRSSHVLDHSVASQLVQQKEFNLKNPSAYHYDILLLGFLTLLCGLLAIRKPT
ncbi:boron transporter 4 [Artemisia annua]|uniref:Boron transporter 4 n=1 Tax=Artemisia annua TaxID=35608 RepID=A0A2U1L315_ARTAN|nr:boron transporter 4 [Artemisia annua]